MMVAHHNIRHRLQESRLVHLTMTTMLIANVAAQPLRLKPMHELNQLLFVEASL